jgi:hypothetical protein
MGTIFFGKTYDCDSKKQQPYHNSQTMNDKSRAESRLSTPATTTATKGIDWSGWRESESIGSRHPLFC